MKDMEQILDKISQETLKSLDRMSNEENADKRKTEAKITHLLCQSMGSLVDSASAAMSEMVGHPFLEDDYEDE